jgi:hypothetical protein
VDTSELPPELDPTTDLATLERDPVTWVRVWQSSNSTSTRKGMSAFLLDPDLRTRALSRPSWGGHGLGSAAVDNGLGDECRF